jgi:hypothetical protein
MSGSKLQYVFMCAVAARRGTIQDKEHSTQKSLSLNFNFTFLEYQILAHNSFPDVLDFLDNRLEV